MYEAKVIADSICNGHRITTMQLTHPKCIHQDFMTHSMFARNADSSRAIPFTTMLKRLQDNPFIPQSFGKNQKGMQAGELLNERDYKRAVGRWLAARDNAIMIALEMADPLCPHCRGKGHTGAGDFGDTCRLCGGSGEGLNIHKQDVNRLLEPWMWITLCVTGMCDAWSNYFSLRCHPDADPKIQPQAYLAQLAYFRSEPQRLPPGSWHTPYLDNEEFNQLMQIGEMQPAKVSAGRCARTSYTTQEGKRDFEEDLRLHDRLRNRTPLHASPFAHVCQAQGDDNRYAMYTGWKSYRHMIPGEYMTEFKPNHPDLVISTSV